MGDVIPEFARFITAVAYRFHTEVELRPGLLAMPKEESQHLFVSRLKAGDSVVLFGGDGLDFPAVLLEITRHGATLQVAEPVRNTREVPGQILVAAPLPKGDREQFLIEKLTELGVTRFVPLKTNRSVIHPEPKRLERLRRHVVEASKQCGRSQLMAIEPLKVLADLPGDPSLAGYLKYFGDVPNANSGFWTFPDNLGSAKNLALLVGPEGGLEECERDTLLKAGWISCHLGKRVLRIETAAILLASKAACLMERA